MSIFKARLSQETFKTVRMAPRVKRTMSSLSVKEPFTYYQQTQKQTSILLLKLFSLSNDRSKKGSNLFCVAQYAFLT